MTVKEFTSLYRWVSDGKLDSWHVIDKAPYEGDCDDFAMTVAKLDAGSVAKVLLNPLKYQFYWCNSPNGGAHMILWVRGKGWIDNFFPYWRDKPTGHTHRIYYPKVFILLKLLIGKFDKT